MAQALTAQLARMVSGLRFADLPAEAIRIARTGIADCLAVLVAGSDEPAVQSLRATLAELGGPAEARVGYSNERLPAPHAAWINGTAGHVLDYDDVARGHPSVAIVPALLAEGTVLNASGSDVITAYVAGYETWMELISREPDNHQMKGLHPTSIFGALAAAAACANLRRLDEGRTINALGIAAAQASGLTSVYGSMVKSVQVGRAAYTGVIAARSAAHGMQATGDAFDGERGFLRAHSPNRKADIDTPSRAGGAEGQWHILRQGLSIKRYPMCYCAHRAIDATLETAPRLNVSEIEKIEVTLGKIQATTLKNHRPRSGMDALFSVEFAIACALLEGNVGLQQLNDAVVQRADVQALVARVSVSTTEDYDPDEPALSRFDQVRFFMRGGDVIESVKVARALGSAQRPISADALRQKFVDCFARGAPQVNAVALFDGLNQLECVASVRDLWDVAACHSGKTIN
jgi:2-methylcitrate dehydratase PrpD